MPKYSDDQYAAALNTLPPGKLPKQSEKIGVDINGVVADVPIGKFLTTLRNAGRRKEFGPRLTEALGRHGITPMYIGGTWVVPRDPQATRVLWTDENYAAALNTLPPGKLPKDGDKIGVDINGFVADVPIGSFLTTLRSDGRQKEFEPRLTEALEHHGITPMHIGGTWVVPRDPQTARVLWTDDNYAAALNTLPPGKLPKDRDKIGVDINGFVADVPIGKFLATLRSDGRQEEFEPRLTEALERHDITPMHIGGKWAVPRDPRTGRVMWKDDHYAAALNTLPPGKLPKHNAKIEVNIKGVVADVPIGTFLKNVRNNGRQKEFEPRLTEALERHGLSSAGVEDGRKIGEAVADAGNRVLHGEQPHSRNPLHSYSHPDSGGYPARGDSGQSAVSTQGMQAISVTAAPTAPYSYSVSSSAQGPSAMPEPPDRPYGHSGESGYPTNPVTAKRHLPTSQSHPHAGPSSHAAPSSHQNAESQSKRSRR
ncbi:hypothetical protein [Streptomyces niveus]|uniref:hypothetical protein n=1 Tax=Streptomyces niveus TaxID=193462 RepID=UPI00366424C3